MGSFVASCGEDIVHLLKTGALRHDEANAGFQQIIEAANVFWIDLL